MYVNWRHRLIDGLHCIWVLMSYKNIYVRFARGIRISMYNLYVELQYLCTIWLLLPLALSPAVTAPGASHPPVQHQHMWSENVTGQQSVEWSCSQRGLWLPQHALIPGWHFLLVLFSQIFFSLQVLIYKINFISVFVFIFFSLSCLYLYDYSLLLPPICSLQIVTNICCKFQLGVYEEFLRKYSFIHHFHDDKIFQHSSYIKLLKIEIFYITISFLIKYPLLKT